MSLAYMLDTNTVSYALREEGGVARQISTRKPSAMCVSAISVAELRFGASKEKSPRRQDAISTFLESMRIFPFGEAEAAVFGQMLAELERVGTPLGSYDALIAAHAITLNLTLVTRDRAFNRIPNLSITDWF